MADKPPHTVLTARIRALLNGASAPAHFVTQLCDEVERLTDKLVDVHKCIPPRPPVHPPALWDLSDEMKLKLYDTAREKLHGG